jgi:hypothetical protein
VLPGSIDAKRFSSMLNTAILKAHNIFPVHC